MKKNNITSYFKGIFGSACDANELEVITSWSITKYIFPVFVICIFPILPVTGLGGGGSDKI